jgi:DNA-binding beta-propeller fold protein YncE
MNKAQGLLAAVAVLTLTGSGCGGGGYGAILSPPPSYTLGGTVSGLDGSGLVLQNNGVANGSTIGRAANGTYPDLTGDSLANGTAYNVTVKTQPTNPSQTCVVTNGMGTIGSANITNIAVTCTTNADRFVYVANGGSNNISAYAINAASGALTAISGSPFPAGTLPYSMTVDPSGKFAYVANQGNGNVSAFAIDGTIGALTTVSGSPFATGPVPFSVAVDPSSKFVYVTNSNSGNVSAYTINPSSGALTAVSGSPFAAGNAPYSVSDPSSTY